MAGAFKAPTLIHLYDSPPYFNPFAGGFVLISNSGLASQKGTCYEFGLRIEGQDSLRIGINLFDYMIRDEIDFNEATVSYANIGRSRHSGIEVDLSRMICSNLAGDASFVYNSSTFRNGEYRGNQINGVPEITYSLELEYRMREILFISMSAAGMSRQYLDQANTQKLDDYYALSLSGRISLASINFGIKIDNLLDHKYSYTGYMDPLIRQFRYYPAAPRTVLLTISNEF
jgi:iron complex outermembrane receptor protein